MSINMSCVAHSYNLERAEAQMKHLKANGTVGDVDWALGHAFMLLERYPEDQLTNNARNAIDRAKNAYETGGVESALTHFGWLRESLEYLGACEVNSTLEIISNKLAAA